MTCFRPAAILMEPVAKGIKTGSPKCAAILEVPVAASGSAISDRVPAAAKTLQTPSIIKAHVDGKTTDGYLLRLFGVGSAKKCNNQIRKTSYVQYQQVRQIRKKMMEIMTRGVQTNDLKEVNKLIPDTIGKDVEKACQSIYPLHDVYVRKVKMLKKPKFELSELIELYGNGNASGKPSEKVFRPILVAPESLFSDSPAVNKVISCQSMYGHLYRDS
ncbi:40S ribosomal protein S3a-like [Hyla sarda]|uniref:40S ribosomal protein S3a-like n=1 Tax=Hyla sarda TaxID=327740 RepID=UPI0024C2DF45|nr:40S ribosomal protein S3a-like [Hyla sarda]